MPSEIFTKSELLTMFPDYQLTLERVGRLAATYQAVDKSGSKHFLKVLLPKNISDDEMIIQFANEAKALNLLDHPGFLTFSEYGTAMDVPYILTEWINGLPLHEAFPFGYVATEDIAYILSKVCFALAHMHELGMSHFGVKSSNVLANIDGEVKLLQLGQTRFSDKGNRYARPLGTPGYTAPEVTELGEGISPLSDQYACGSLLFEMLTNVNPAQSNKSASELTECDELFDEIVARACHQDPSQRFSSIRQMGEVLLDFSKGKTTTLPRPENLSVAHEVKPAHISNSSSHTKKNSKSSIVVMVVLLLLLFNGVTFFIKTYRTPIQASNPAKTEQVVEYKSDNEVRPKLQLDRAYFVDNQNKEEISFYKKLGQSNIIEKEINGVKFILFLPKGKPRGVVASIPFKVSKDFMINQLGQFKYLRKAHDRGYAIISWISPARRFTEGIDYGLNDDQLSKEQATVRKERWSNWLPKIDSGLTALCEEFNLPQNGFIGRVDCVSAARISRYLSSYPSRFSVVIYDKPHSMYTPSSSGNHIFSFLVSPIDQPYYPFGKRFFIQAKDKDYPVSMQVMSLGANIKRNEVVNMMFDYIYNAYDEFALRSTLSAAQIAKLADKFRADIDQSEYIQDCINEGVYLRSEANWIPNEQKIGIPISRLGAFWESGYKAKSNSHFETFNQMNPKECRALKIRFGEFKIESGDSMEISVKGSMGKGLVIKGDRTVIGLEIAGISDKKNLYFKVFRINKDVEMGLKIRVRVDGLWVEVMNNLLDHKGNSKNIAVPLPEDCNRIQFETHGEFYFDDFSLSTIPPK